MSYMFAQPTDCFRLDSISTPFRPQKARFPVRSVEIDREQDQVDSILTPTAGKSLSDNQTDYLSKSMSFIFLISALSLPLPTIEGSFEEQISFEWRSDLMDEFIVTLKPNGDLIYSGVFKTGTVCGVEKFDGCNIPDVIKTGLLKTT